MNPRVEVKTNKERRVDVFTYYYRNRVKLLEKYNVTVWLVDMF